MSRPEGHGSARVPRFLIILAGALVWTSADGQRQWPRPAKVVEVKKPAPPRRRHHPAPLPELCLDSSARPHGASPLH